MNRESRRIQGRDRFQLTKAISLIVLGGVLALAIPLFIFWHGEAEREQLLTLYQAPPSFFEEILNKREGTADSLMRSNESLVCAIGGYGNVDELSQLNAKQKKSIPKEKLPSEDIAWYLLFFSNDSISRIYLIDSIKLEGYVDSNGSGCINREGQFSVNTTEEINGGTKQILNLSKGKQS